MDAAHLPALAKVIFTQSAIQMPASSADTLADARRNTFTSFSPNSPPLFQGPTQNPVSPFSAPSLVLQLVAVSQALPFVTWYLLESPAQGFAARPSSRACRMRYPHALRSCAFGRTAREATLFLSEHRVAGARCRRVSFVAGDARAHLAEPRPPPLPATRVCFPLCN